MSRNSHPFQVLVTTGNATVIASGNTVDDLAVGQIGIFDAETNLSIDGSDPVKKFYLAVGVDSTGGSTFDSINVSAGQSIPSRGITNYQKNAYNAGSPQIIDFVGYTADCDENYSIKLEFKNALLRQRLGFVGFSKTYAIKSGCCEGCEECPSGDCVAVTEAMVNAINLDVDDFVEAVAIGPKVGSVLVTGAGPTGDGTITFTFNGTAIALEVANADDAAATATKIAAALSGDAAFDGYTVAVDGTTAEKVNIVKDLVTGGLADTLTLVDTDTTGIATTIVAPVSAEITDYDAFATDYPDVCPGIRMTTKPITNTALTNVPAKYYKPLQTTAIPSAGDGFDCNGEFVVAQNATMEEGTGRAVQQLEYRAGGWNGKPGPYRASEATGLAREGFRYFAAANVNYLTISLEYETPTTSSSTENINACETIIAIPTGDTVTSAALLSALDDIAEAMGFTAQS